jgi:hypothetical protein
MDAFFTRVWIDLIAALGGPLTVRLILQPTMSILFAVRDGIRDAREGRPAYFWAIRNNRSERLALLWDGWKALMRVVGLGAVMDATYQIMVFGALRPVELIVVVVLLACVPYLVWRGPANRMASHWMHSKRATVR